MLTSRGLRRRFISVFSTVWHHKPGVSASKVSALQKVPLTHVSLYGRWRLLPRYPLGRKASKDVYTGTHTVTTNSRSLPSLLQNQSGAWSFKCPEDQLKLNERIKDTASPRGQLGTHKHTYTHTPAHMQIKRDSHCNTWKDPRYAF